MFKRKPRHLVGLVKVKIKTNKEGKYGEKEETWLNENMPQGSSIMLNYKKYRTCVV